MSGLHTVDWVILSVYLAGSIGVGLWLRRRASTDLESYFVAGRKMSGWLIGTSMVATTFAADTPLAITGIVAKEGIAGNWFWWSWAFGHLLATFFFARLWRRAEIVTDAEFVELRYSGRTAAALRLLRAFYFAVPINCITMAWVIRAMGKITSVIFPWDQWLGPSIYGRLEAVWPSWVAMRSPSEAISILIGVVIAVTYAALGGLPSVMITDVVQFALAMIGSVALAIYAVGAVGGLDELTARLASTYGDKAGEILAFVPSADAAWLPLEAFVIYLTVQWWAHKYSDGGGILVQRLSAAKDEGHALRGSSWFVIAHYVIRPWPWILVALAALVIYPLDGGADGPAAAAVMADREMAYPVLMAQLLPAGLLGIMVTGMTAAFMSTIDTHVTWGASYLVRDVYQRFLRPQASDKELVRASRVAIVIIVVVALAIMTQVDSIAEAWKFITALGAGLGLVGIARWLWWRVNASSEIAGLVSAVVMAAIIYGPMGGEFGGEALPFHWILLLVVMVSTAAVVAVTLLTPKPDIGALRRFYSKIRPVGWWGPVRRADDPAPTERLGTLLAAWVLSGLGLFALLFGLGECLLGSAPLGLVMCTAGVALWAAALRLAGAFERAPCPD